MTAQQLVDKTGKSQPTISRAIESIREKIVRIRHGRSIQYAAIRSVPGLPDLPIYRISPAGQVELLGKLIPVYPQGFAFEDTAGLTRLSAGLPWWLDDMRPQGYLGRHFARHISTLTGLPEDPRNWTAENTLYALALEGHDPVGNLLVGEQARERFIHQPMPQPLAATACGDTYVHMAEQTDAGNMPGSSAGGEQRKFTALIDGSHGPRHVIVKFTIAEDNPHVARWRDLLLAEHHALNILRMAGIPAAASRIVDVGKQRFLEVERFDRTGLLGRHGIISLAAMDAEFLGKGAGPWPDFTHALAQHGIIDPAAHAAANLLYAFGVLIGNSDMHTGNLSFMVGEGRPYTLAPCYDMLPMCFRPLADGSLKQQVPSFSMSPHVPQHTWRQAQALAEQYAQALQAEPRLSPDFAQCLAALATHREKCQNMIARIG